MIVERLAERWELKWGEGPLQGQLAEGRPPAWALPAGAERPHVALLCPQTFYNDAGRSVGPARGSFKLPLERVLVVHDEIDLPFDEVRTRLGGGLAGNNGLKSIKRELGGAEFMRVRVGVGRPDSTDPEIVAAYVLARFRSPTSQVQELVEGPLPRWSAPSSAIDRGAGGGRLDGGARRLAAHAARGDRAGRRRPAAGGRGRPRVRLGLAAPLPDRGARRPRRRRAGAPDARRRRRRPRRARPRGRPARVARAAARPLLPLARRRLRVASRAAAAPRRAARRGPRRAAQRGRRRRGPADAPVVVVSAAALSEKVPDPALRPALVHAARRRAARPRRVRRRARRRGLRAGRPGRGARAVRDARRPARRVRSDRGPRRAGRHVRRRDRIAALVLDLHAALARRRRGGRDRARRRARAGAPRAGRARSGGLPSAAARNEGEARAPGHRRAAAGRALRRAARPDRREAPATDRAPSSSSPPRRRSSRR